MIKSKDILVVTTSSTEGLKIIKYLKPISAHIVAGTNLFSDFLGGLTDVFGGRSSSYQKQLNSLCDEAIESIKFNAAEIGANCVIGLKVDMDEISGKGKSMFMLSAIGTAVIIEKEQKVNPTFESNQKPEFITIEKINILKRKKELIKDAMSDDFRFEEKTWEFITSNQIEEIFPLILKYFPISMVELTPSVEPAFYKNIISYIEAFDGSKKIKLLYDKIEEEEEMKVILFLSNIIKKLGVYNFERTMGLLNNKDLKKQKIGLRIARYDKSFYEKQDVENYIKMRDLIINSFKERGEKSTKIKKSLLSSKEQEVWICECGTTNDLEKSKYCGKCYNDIYGFELADVKPYDVINFINQRIELIEECIN